MDTAERTLRALSESPLEDLPLLRALEVMQHFYLEYRAIGALPLEDDGDGLLFQWGTYDWGAGRHFDINITRQVTYPDGPEVDMWQLGVTYHYDPAHPAPASGNEWCWSPADTPPFIARHTKSPMVEYFRDQAVVSVEVIWDQV